MVDLRAPKRQIRPYSILVLLVGKSLALATGETIICKSSNASLLQSSTPTSAIVGLGWTTVHDYTYRSRLQRDKRILRIEPHQVFHSNSLL